MLGGPTPPHDSRHFNPRLLNNVCSHDNLQGRDLTVQLLDDVFVQETVLQQFGGSLQSLGGTGEQQVKMLVKQRYAVVLQNREVREVSAGNTLRCDVCPCRVSVFCLEERSEM